jgi:formylglycine-generating enzyme required for sulfatase activity
MMRSGVIFPSSLFRFTVVCVAAACILGCAPNNSRPPRIETRNGMRLIAAAGASFLQGAQDSLASNDEKPSFPSGFSYNYWIDTTEVTQQEYFNVTGRRPVPDTGAVGRGPAYPVCHVSWFDAVLFCNQKSKRDSLDTVYDYISLSRLAGGSVNEITGLAVDYSKNGYRLPTEAEWEFAAREASSALFITSALDRPNAEATAWFSENSGGTSHPAAQKQPNRLGLYDMAGNLFEWTGDWKGFYRQRAITNSIGGREPDASFERVIKGGSFRDGLYTLRPTRRGATYAVGLSSAVDYIGFRCARGAVDRKSVV